MVGTKCRSTGHIRFFINRKNKAQRAVLDFLLKEIERNGNGNAVISTQAGTVRTENISFADKFNRILYGIIDNARFRYTNHIHMTLQYGYGRIFISRCSRYIGDDIIHVILSRRNTEFGKTTDNIIAYFFFMMRRPGMSGKTFKFL